VSNDRARAATPRDPAAKKRLFNGTPTSKLARDAAPAPVHVSAATRLRRCDGQFGTERSEVQILAPRQL
jgi:hypothetical protein